MDPSALRYEILNLLAAHEATGSADLFKDRAMSERLYAFDLLFLNGRDLRGLPLLERKRRLLDIMPTVECRALYLDHVAERGCDLYRAACERDLEGIVAKWSCGTYRWTGVQRRG